MAALILKTLYKIKCTDVLSILECVYSSYSYVYLFYEISLYYKLIEYNWKRTCKTKWKDTQIKQVPIRLLVKNLQPCEQWGSSTKNLSTRYRYRILYYRLYLIFNTPEAINPFIIDYSFYLTSPSVVGDKKWKWYEFNCSFYCVLHIQ